MSELCVFLEILVETLLEGSFGPLCNELMAKKCFQEPRDGMFWIRPRFGILLLF